MLEPEGKWKRENENEKLPSIPWALSVDAHPCLSS